MPDSITIFTLCVDPESDRQVAFLAHDPESRAGGFGQNDAIVKALLKAKLLIIRPIDYEGDAEKAHAEVAQTAEAIDGLPEASATTGLTFQQAEAFMRAGKAVKRAVWGDKPLTLRYNSGFAPHWELKLEDAGSQKWPERAPRHDDETRENLAATDWVVVA